MKALDLKDVFHQKLDAIYGKNEVESFFFLSLEHYLNIPRFQLALDPEFTLTKDETNLFFKILEALKQQQPIQYILGETEFFGLKFIVNEHVLIPRQETEELVDWIIRDNSKNNEITLNILDIGTGSGCIAIALAKNLPNSNVYALDISSEALKVARDNAKINEVEIQFIQADVLSNSNDNHKLENSMFDIIVSNPPYVRISEKGEMKPNVLENEPYLALFVDDDDPLKFYKAITKFANQKLKNGGQLYFEINQYLGEETKQLLIDANYDKIELLEDLNSNLRMLKGLKK
ncbi:peptide chain release factor N(5)-glutamine methyltransferase [Winogradskyella vincentii]|uniref:Release factor glutamine methyltransferase n=1 Tax=Winogradskyella vincentii TaxID=2877122 RepID=A0ABS7Y1P3_9FLAO|nr:peptide chain release factor N(5)-glutamine methyltransferase [Winogradskyella vincentii]MCA0152757.1 peptide chain release factor N(5)-glutamine methyltransferase [Winogradskyella vincentii]